MPSTFKPFLTNDGSFRFLTGGEFRDLSNAQKSEYLDRASQELKKSVDELRAMVTRRDQETRA